VRSPEQQRAVLEHIATSLDVSPQDITGVIEWVSTDSRAAVAHRTAVFFNRVCVIAIEKAAEKIGPADFDGR